MKVNMFIHTYLIKNNTIMPGNPQFTIFGDEDFTPKNNTAPAIKFKNNNVFSFEIVKNSTVSFKKMVGSIPIILMGVCVVSFSRPVLRYGVGGPLLFFGMGLFYGHYRDYHMHKYYDKHNE